MKKTYIITGAAGHLGNTIINLLNSEDCEIRALLLEGEDDFPIKHTKAVITYGNVCNKDSLYPLFCDLDGFVCVIHCAGIVSIASKVNKQVYDVNVNGTNNIVDLCKQFKVDKLVYVSSVHAIKEAKNNLTVKETNEFNPDWVIGEYAKTKAQATKNVLLEKDNLNVTVVCPSGIIGPSDYKIGHTTKMIIDYINGSLTAGTNGGYDFVDVRDVAKGIISASKVEKSGQVYILSGGYHSVREMFDMLSQILKRKKIKIYLPKWFLNCTAYLCELYYKILKQKPLFTKYSIYTLFSKSDFSNEKAKTELGFKVTPFYNTLFETVAWLEENNFVKKSKIKKYAKKVKI